jgi:hypothetical protein
VLNAGPHPGRDVESGHKEGKPVKETLSRRSLFYSAGGVTLLRAQTPAAAPAGAPNQPVGIAKGIYPGRVVWTREPKAAAWGGSGDGHWWDSRATNETAIDNMVTRAIRELTGQSSDSAAWDALFRHFKAARGESGGYLKGEKITIKANLVGCIHFEKNIDPQTYEFVRKADYMNTSPHIIAALLRQLVEKAGVDQKDISVGDTLALFPKPYHDICRREFPDVRYLDCTGGNERHPRARVEPSSIPVYWSQRPAGVSQDFVPAAYAEATYLINLANLKSHPLAGVTLCAKNHYGSLIRTPAAKGYFNIHNSLPRNAPGPGRYRALVDMMAHQHIGGKTMLFLVDGLYPGVHPIEVSPRKWTQAPFNGNWAASLLASQDPVAIDSVAHDFLYAEWLDYPRMPGADDYLHEAALAGDPPSGTFYDPNHAENTVRVASLGVHEHWNNASERKYSRNLGRREGIELAAAI